MKWSDFLAAATNDRSLNRSGTGSFLVYNDCRDVSSFTPDKVLGHSFVVKYTRPFDY